MMKMIIEMQKMQMELMKQTKEKFASESRWKINADLVKYLVNFEQEKEVSV